MSNYNTIRRFCAGFFLLLFSFCVTPKRFLHDLLANHKDAQMARSDAPEQVAASGFHCHTDDLVVEAPFLPGIPAIIPSILSSVEVSFADPLHQLFSSCVFHADGRGPPAAFCA